MKHLTLHTSPFVLVAALFATACSGANTAGGTSGDPGSGGNEGTGGGNADGGGVQGDGGSSSESTIAVTVGSSSTGSGANTCDSAGDEDRDQDGITKDGGDCNDCDANVNPNAIEVVITEIDPETGEVPEAADEDCDGTVDNTPAQACDGDLALATGNPTDAARAIDLCQGAPAQGGWGVVSARWTRPAGGSWADNPGAGSKIGVLENFGPNVLPFASSRLLGMSSGLARLPGQDGACTSQSCQVGGSGQAPPGYPASVPGCDGGPSTPIYDDVALELRLRAPSNATGFSFDFKFYSFEYPEWVCDRYNDQFAVIMDPAPPGAQNGNISFDAAGNPVSVNIGFFDVCQGCAAGTDELVGTGFDSLASPGDAGGTSWLRTTAPVVPGSEFTLRLVIWDTGDANLDSTAVIDNFRWIANGGTVVVETGEVPGPN